MLKVATTLVYEDQAEEAVSFYTSIFPNSRIVSTRRHGEVGPGEKGTLMSAAFELEGQRFMAVNAGRSFTSWQGASLFVSCDRQEEVDELWERLSQGGERGPCGWVTDKFGVSWQVVPRVLSEMLADEDPAKAERVLSAMVQMTKVKIEPLRAAYEAG